MPRAWWKARRLTGLTATVTMRPVSGHAIMNGMASGVIPTGPEARACLIVMTERLRMPSVNMGLEHTGMIPADAPTAALPKILHSAYMSLAKFLPTPAGVLMLKGLNWSLRRSGRKFWGRTKYGALFSCDPRDYIQMNILNFGMWEPEVSHVIGKILKPGDCFADIGANIGYDSLLAAGLVGPSGSVISIEASPSTHAKLNESIRLNGAANIRSVNVAASDHPGRLALYARSEFQSGTVTTLSREGKSLIAEVDALPLDMILAESERKKPRLIKMDIEGGEVAVPRRLLDTMDLYPRLTELIVEMSVIDEEAAAVFDAMSRAGFAAFGIANVYEYEWYLRWKTPGSPRSLTAFPTEQTDILFIKSSRSVMSGGRHRCRKL